MPAFRRLTVCALLVVLLGACGSDDSDSNATDEGPAAAVSVGGATANEADEAEPEQDVAAEDDEEGAEAETIDACDLLTDEEAGDVLGGPIVESGPAMGVGESVCAWEIEGDWSVTVSVGSPGTAPEGYEPQSLMGGEPEEVEALDGRGWKVGLGTVDFAADERLNSVQVVTITSGPDEDAAAELAVVLRDRIESAG